MKDRCTLFHIITLLAVLTAFTACLFMMSGCATIKQEPWTATAHKSLKTAAIAYDVLMSSARDLDKQHLLSPSDKMKILETGLEFWGAYHSAVDLLEAYIKTGNNLDKMKYVNAWDQVSIGIENLRRHLAPFVKEVR